MKNEAEEKQDMVLTSTVKIKSEVSSLLPVKTDKPIPKEKLKKAMKILSKIQAKAPVFIGDTVRKNFVEKGTNLISTKSVEK